MKYVLILIAALFSAAIVLTSAPSVQADGMIEVVVGSRDGDPCNDREEAFTNPVKGGMRDPDNFWDFFDTPDGSNNRDRAVAGADFFRILGRFGAVGNPNIDPLSPPPAAGYHPAFDRGPSSGPNHWNLTEANGAITGTDFFAVIGQYGHTCEGPVSGKVDIQQECGGELLEPGDEPLEGELTNGESTSDCIVVHDPVTGEIVDVVKVTNEVETAFEGTSTEPIPPELVGGWTGASSAPSAEATPTDRVIQPANHSKTALWSYWTCSKKRSIESYIFRSDLATVKVNLTYRAVTQAGNPYYTAVLEVAKWKSVSASGLWTISNYNSSIQTWYVVPWRNLRAQTYSGFHAEIGVSHWGFSFTMSQDAQITVWIRGGLTGEGHLGCWGGSEVEK